MISWYSFPAERRTRLAREKLATQSAHSRWPRYVASSRNFTPSPFSQASPNPQNVQLHTCGQWGAIGRRVCDGSNPVRVTPLHQTTPVQGEDGCRCIFFTYWKKPIAIQVEAHRHSSRASEYWSRRSWSKTRDGSIPPSRVIQTLIRCKLLILAHPLNKLISQLLSCMQSTWQGSCGKSSNQDPLSNVQRKLLFVSSKEEV